MKNFRSAVQKICLLFLYTGFFASSIFSQTNGDYQTRGSGNWNGTTTWQTYSGGIWTNTSTFPTSANGIITILNGHTVTITADLTADQIITNSGGQVIVNSGVTLTINDGAGIDMIVNGTLVNYGSVSYATSVTRSFGSGSLYNHAKNGGGLPIATWDPSSTCEVTGIIDILPTRFNQTFGNFKWNCTGQTTQAALADPLTVSGNFTILSTGSGQLQLATGTSTIAGVLTLTNGKIKTSNTNLLSLGSSATVFGGSSSSFIDGPMAYTGTGSKTFPIGKGNSYRPVTLGSIIGTSPVIQVEVFNSGSGGTPGTDLTKISSVRYWQLNLNSGSFTSCTVNLTYGSDDGVTDAAYLRVAQSSTLTGTYNNRNGTGSANGSGNITSSSISALGYFTLANATGGNNPVPVELTSFTASIKNYSVHLNWTTATEVSNYGFEVERSTDKINWSEVAFINGNGNSNSPKEYSFVDSKVSSGKYYYRLKQIDNDGTFVFSNEIEITTAKLLTDFVVEQNFPNPFNPSTTIKFGFKEPVNTKVVIYDALGSEITTLFNDIVEENKIYSLDYDGSRLASGIYYYSISGGNYFIVKKMILTK